MWTVTSLGKVVLILVDRIPKRRRSKTVVDYVSDLLVGVEIFGFKVEKALLVGIPFVWGNH